MNNNFKDFYKKTTLERTETLKNEKLFNDELNKITEPIIFEHLIENYVSTFEVGLGVAPNFLIDGKIYHVPMATEESSVVAGASHAAKIIYDNGGFQTIRVERTMIGQVIFKNILDQAKFKNYLETNFDNFEKIARKAHPDIYKLGGGVKHFEVLVKELNFVCLRVYVDTLDAMGANTINTILESIANHVENSTEEKVLMSILSNLAVGSLVTTKVSIDPNTLKHSDIIGQNIELANQYASIDSFRAVTHNKGVMNGVSALMLATGNDTRGIEAGAHAYASITGKYIPLTKWFMEDGKLIGLITIPLALGTVGGAINVLPKAKLSFEILNVKTAKELMKVAAAVGLAQNFAALYALTTDGINKGHMRLHARNIALDAGATKENINDVINYMFEKNSITRETAKEFFK